jgi:hypothetical protein
MPGNGHYGILMSPGVRDMVTTFAERATVSRETLG